MIVRELITRLGFDADQKKVNQFDASIKNLTKALAALVAGASAATAAAFKLASDTARYGDEVAKTSRMLGVGIEELQRYRFAFDRVGVSQEQTDAALRRFNVTLGQASQGMGQGAQIFNMLGVAIRGPNGEMRSMQDLMPEVVTALRGITNESQRAAITQQLFGRSSAALVANLEGGGEELRALGAEFDALGGGLSGPQALAAEAFTDAMTNMQAAFRSLRLQVGARLMPIFQDLIESFTEFMQVNRELIMARIQRAFEILIGVMRVVMSVVRTLWRAIDGLAQTMGGWEVTLRIIGIALLAVFGAKMVTAIMGFVGAVNAAGGAMAIMRIASLKLAVAMKAIPLIAIIGLIVLLVDEIFNWMRGNDTVIGRILGSWEDFKDRVMGVFTAVIDAAKAFWAGLVAVFDNTIMRPINAIADGFAAVIERVRGMWGEITQWMAGRIAGILPQWLQRRLGFTADAGEGFDMPDLSRITPESVANDMQSADGGDVRNTTLNNQADINITVPPGTTQEQVDSIRDQIDRAMERQIDNAALALEVR